MIDLPASKKIVLFDGVCGLCNTFVSKIIKYDTKNNFVFASLQSNIGKQIINHIKIDTSKADSIILYEPHISYYIKSSAVLKIINDFGGIWKVTQLLFIIPNIIRDIVYDFIAKNRYKWFGKNKKCKLLTTELKDKFL
ncbi:MAG: DUF393 domain-containing protein [Tenacibaculum sp.]|nr:DUF393 domain-containing protein [Tenacibaculum sp.]